MADAQIVAGGASPAPLAYTIPGSQEIIVKALFASFDGTAAGGAFLPCIRVKAPGGVVVGEYVTTASVAAGASADVSFFPEARAAQTSSSTAVIARQTFVSGVAHANSVSCGPAASGRVTWNGATSGGYPDDLLDLTAPTAPKVRTTGVYNVAVEIDPHTAGLPATTGIFYAELDLDETGDDPFLIHSSGPYYQVGGTVNYPSVSLGFAWYLPAGAQIGVTLQNVDPTHTIVFWMDAYIQQLS